MWFDPDMAAPKPPAEGGEFQRFLKLALIVFGLILAGLLALVFLGGDGRIPFVYEGFD